MNETCDPYNTSGQTLINGTLLCNCHKGYYGDYCESHHEWYSSVLITIFSLQTIFIACIFSWIACRTIYIIKNKKYGFDLSKISLGLNFFCCLLRIIYLWSPSRSVLGSIENESTIYFQIIGVWTPISLWMGSSLLIMGFWYDIFRKFGQKQITKKTRTVVISISTAIFLGSTVGMILIISTPGGNPVGLFLILGLIFICILTMSIYIHKIRTAGNKISNKAKSKSKLQWSVKVFIGLDICWSLFFFSNILMAMISGIGSGQLTIIPDILFRITESLIIFLLMMAIDYNFNSLRSVVSCGFDGQSRTLPTESGGDLKSGTHITGSNKSTHSGPLSSQSKSEVVISTLEEAEIESSDQEKTEYVEVPINKKIKHGKKSRSSNLDGNHKKNNQEKYNIEDQEKHSKNKHDQRKKQHKKHRHGHIGGDSEKNRQGNNEDKSGTEDLIFEIEMSEPSKISGTLGTSDKSKTSETSNTSETSGTSNTSETSGTSNTSETSGTSNTSETSGTLNTSETSGTLNTSETLGTLNTSETLGTSETVSLSSTQDTEIISVEIF